DMGRKSDRDKPNNREVHHSRRKPVQRQIIIPSIRDVTLMYKRDLKLVCKLELLTMHGCRDREIWNDNGEVESATENREVWDTKGKMNTGDRKVWVDSDGNEVVK